VLRPTALLLTCRDEDLSTRERAEVIHRAARRDFGGRGRMGFMPKQSDDLTRKDAPSQETEKAKLTIPVPTRDEAISLFQKAARKTPKEKAAKPKG
jgi:hypothetical protein